MSDLRVALEDALAEDPDDRAARSALADWLADQPDPALAARGEFITVQLALEDPQLPAARRAALRAREAELLGAHEADWLGPLWPVLRSTDTPSDHMKRHGHVNRAAWRRGWLDDLYLFRGGLGEVRPLLLCPAARLLRSLHLHHVGYDSDYTPGAREEILPGSEYPTLHVLRGATFLPNLRRLTVGQAVDFENESYSSKAVAEGIAGVVARCPRLDSLHLYAPEQEQDRLFTVPTMTHLNELVLYHEAEEHPVELLAGNPALTRLHTLRIHPGHSEGGSYLPRPRLRALFRSPYLAGLRRLHLHATDLGDEGCRDLVESGILGRLEVLDLRFGCVTDAGARTLAACPDVRRLQSLSLEHNQLTGEGRAALQALGIPVRCNQQYEVGSDEHLWTGDME